MNDKHDQHAKLIADTFHADWETGRPADFAREAAAMARRRNHVRRSLRAAGTAAVIAVAAVVLLRRPAMPPPTLVEPAKSVAASRGYEILSDDELLAQVHDQPLLIMKRADGSKQIVVLADSSE
jgi:hypothetical protein